MDAAVLDMPLAYRADFALGDAMVRPSLRMIEGPVARVPLEPRAMQVLLAFADAGGAVLTRDDLIRDCWSGRIVGDDAVNRAIAVLRRAARQSGSSFGIETIPRIGYRLAIDAGSTPREMPREGTAGPDQNRRVLTASLLALLVPRRRGSVAMGRDARRFGQRLDRARAASPP
jgi:DNA-binding winged helix-turn-helix (wHTH) protein